MTRIRNNGIPHPAQTPNGKGTRTTKTNAYFYGLIYLPEKPGPIAWSDARPTGMRTVVGVILGSGNILSWRLVMQIKIKNDFL